MAGPAKYLQEYICFLWSYFHNGRENICKVQSHIFIIYMSLYAQLAIWLILNLFTPYPLHNALALFYGGISEDVQYVPTVLMGFFEMIFWYAHSCAPPTCTLFCFDVQLKSLVFFLSIIIMLHFGTEITHVKLNLIVHIKLAWNTNNQFLRF